MKVSIVELAELIKANYSYEDSTDYYHVQDILLLTDKLLKRNDVDRGKLLEALERVEENER